MTKTKTVHEHIRITGRMDERKKAVDYCLGNKYRIKAIGPRPLKSCRAVMVDTSRFILVAERKVNDYYENQ